MTSDETRPDRDALREQLRRALTKAWCDTIEQPGMVRVEASTDAVLAVVEPALAQRDAEHDEQLSAAEEAFHRMWTERDQARAEMERLRLQVSRQYATIVRHQEVYDQARRVIAAVTVLCDEGKRLGHIPLCCSRRLDAALASLASGDGTGS